MAWRTINSLGFFLPAKLKYFKTIVLPEAVLPILADSSSVPMRRSLSPLSVVLFCPNPPVSLPLPKDGLYTMREVGGDERYFRAEKQ